jgi:RNA polymerase primary sigma factor
MVKKFIDTTDTCINRYFKDINGSNLLTPEQEIEIALRIQKGDEKAIEELVSANLLFVVSIAKEYQGHGVELPDLINDGNEGLIKAAMKFDPSRGFRFISYAVWWIKQCILQGLNENSRTIRLPTNIINKLSQVRKLLAKFEMDNGRMPVDGEIISEVGSDLQVEYTNMTYPSCTSLNIEINEDGDELCDLLCDNSAKSPDELESNNSLITKELTNALSHLSQREREIIELYFGLNPDFEAMTLEAIGDIYELTKERVRQIKEKAIRKLRHHIRNIFELL